MAGKAGTLWMGDLEPYMDDSFLKEAFRGMGEAVIQTKIIRNKVTGLPLGYGFLEFGDDPAALRALHKCNGKVVPGSSPPKRFKLNHASYSKDQDFSIFVGDLTPEIDDLRLFNCFMLRYPSTRSAKVVLDVDGESKGYGFIRFADEREQQRALSEMQGSTILTSRPIRVSLATQKGKQGSLSMPPMPPSESASSSSPTVAPDYTSYYQNVAYQQQCQDYYQQYQNYQQYYNSYNYGQYYGQTDDGSGAYSYGQYGQGGYDAMYANYNNEDADVEEHDKALNIVQMNESALTKNQDFYASLMDCRWSSPADLLPLTDPTAVK